MHLKKWESGLSLITAALEAVMEGILIVNRQGKIVYYNQNFLVLWQIPASIFQMHDDRQLVDFIRSQLLEPEYFLQKILGWQTPDLECCEEILLQNGHVFECTVKPHFIRGKLIGRIIRFQDMTEHKRQNTQLLTEATHDALTGLPNRKLLIEFLHQAVGYANRVGLWFAVLFVDLDHYKIINDSFGHFLGDLLLKEVALRLQSCVRENDVVGRLGGDEFVIVVSAMNNLDDVVPVVNKILSVIAEPFSIQGHQLKITASIGVSFYSQSEQDPEVFIQQADMAMYCAKKLGRNNFQFYSEQQ